MDIALKIGNYSVSSNPTRGFIFAGGNLGGIISAVLNMVISVAGILLFIWLIWGVMQYIFAGGNKEALAKARARITNAIIGFIIVVLAYTIQEYLKDVFEPQAVNITPVTVPTK